MSAAAARLLNDVRALAPELAARASESEANRTLPRDLVEKLRAMGIFRIFVPKSHGGLELAVPEAVEIVAAIAAADGSAGWTVMIGVSSGLMFSRLPREAFDAVYAKGPDVIQAGAVQPNGRAETVEGGYRVTGRWPTGSGCLHADWIVGGCVVTKSGEPLDGPIPGQPRTRLMALPASVWTIEDTWHALGLKGTGSHHTSLSDAFVPEAQTFEFAGPSCVPGPLFDYVASTILLLHAAFALGVAEGARNDLLALVAGGKQQLFARTTMRDSTVFQYELGRIDADIRASRAYFERQAALEWRRSLAGEAGEPSRLIEAQQMELWVTATCMRAIDHCYTLAGASALYQSSPLQRRLRDIHTGSQHSLAHRRHFVTAGQLRLGLPVLPMSA
jgi:alkylation response protein AidB-like acyl-CoA dehydrogenase